MEDTTEVKTEAKEVSLKEYKKYLHDVFTRRLPSIKECGHKFDANREPKNNCEWCWFTFFNSNGELVKTADQCFHEEGKDIIERIRGKRFVKMFLRFMGTMAEFSKQLQAQKPETHAYNKQTGVYEPVKDENGPEREMEQNRDSGKDTEQAV